MDGHAGLRLEFDYLTRHRSFRELGDLAARSYGAEPRSTLTDEAVWRAFPRGYVGVWVDDRLEGAVLLWPLDAFRAADFLTGGRRERDLAESDLVTVCNSPRTVYYFAGLLVEPAWRGRGMAAHLLAEAMVRWQRDLPWWPPIRFAALVAGREGMGFVEHFGMRRVRSAEATADGHPLYARTFASEADLVAVVESARDAVARKGRLLAERD